MSTLLVVTIYSTNLIFVTGIRVACEYHGSCIDSKAQITQHRGKASIIRGLCGRRETGKQEMAVMSMGPFCLNQEVNLIRFLVTNVFQKLPYMQEDDPVARYYGFKRGDVVKIFRTDDAGEEKLFYRLVVQTKSED